MECKGRNILIPMRLAVSINRNIMECKVFKDSPCALHSAVLIETLWNVKLVYLPAFPVLSSRINRNIMECKDTCEENEPD